MSDHRVGVCILGGGQSKRMGKDKMLLEYNGKKMYESTAERLSSASPCRFLSVNREHIYECLGWTSVTDRFEAGIGPLNGFGSVMEYISELPEDDPQKCDAVLFCGVDMPYFDADEAKAIIGAYRGEDVLAVYAGGRVHPANSIYSISLLPVIKKGIQNGDYRLRTLMDPELQSVGEYHSKRPECYANINTPEEAKKIEGLVL